MGEFGRGLGGGGGSKLTTHYIEKRGNVVSVEVSKAGITRT